MICDSERDFYCDFKELHYRVNSIAKRIEIWQNYAYCGNCCQIDISIRNYSCNFHILGPYQILCK